VPIGSKVGCSACTLKTTDGITPVDRLDSAQCALQTLLPVKERLSQIRPFGHRERKNPNLPTQALPNNRPAPLFYPLAVSKPLTLRDAGTAISATRSEHMGHLLTRSPAKGKHSNTTIGHRGKACAA
jgi:hypothetical protein